MNPRQQTAWDALVEAVQDYRHPELAGDRPVSLEWMQAQAQAFVNSLQ
jgi:hypothetical protein